MSIESDPKPKPFIEADFLGEHGLVIIPGLRDVPKPILREDVANSIKDQFDKEMLQDVLDICCRYLGLKTIQDNFGVDHTARRKWRMEMASQYHKPFIDFYQSDRMRGNKLAPLLMNIGVCLKMSKRALPDGPTKDKILDLQARQPDMRPYNQMPVEQKREFIASVVEFTKEFVSALT